MDWRAYWIKPREDMGDICPVFEKGFILTQKPISARLCITALGVYEACLNKERIGDFVLAPGWTSYEHRLQYQEYDVTQLLETDNQLTVTVGKGWYRSPLPAAETEHKRRITERTAGLLVELTVSYADGSMQTIGSDASWTVSESQVRFSEIYDGEIFDASFFTDEKRAVSVFDGPYHTLIPQQGEKILEQEHLSPVSVFTTPAGETVVDFGQDLTGYVEVSVTAAAGERVHLSHAEVLDGDGNFYTKNYRAAKADYLYICRDGAQRYRPKFTFFGFRYIRVDEFPGGAAAAKAENFTAVVVHSALRRTGVLRCSDALLNRLFENIVWSQKGNFLDVPTDCPQRDERLGWTGDAQVFARAACLHFDCELFFTKWLADLSADQKPDGQLCHVIPAVWDNTGSSAAWGDAATICPWEVYLAYGNPDILRNQFDCMKNWVRYITSHTTTENLWTGGANQFGDWLGLDAPAGSYKGSSREDFIASAFYARSTGLVIRAGQVLGEDVGEFEALYRRIHTAFRRAYPDFHTQTECVLAARFGLTDDPQAAADQLAEMICACGTKLQTGFVGTPYLLHVLSDYGHETLAWDLLLRREYPSWLYPVTKGATTIWEHWDGIREDGSFWSPGMNSFNHYAYGAVADWIYNVAAGIRPLEAAPGYAKAEIAPHPDARLDWLEADLDTRHGHIRSCWKKQDGFWRMEIDTAMPAEIRIGAETRIVEAGNYVFFTPVQ